MMTSRTILLTPAQIVEVYKAGIERGNEEAVAYDWGSSPSGGKFDPLENCLVWDWSCSETFGLEYSARKVWWELFLKDAGEVK